MFAGSGSLGIEALSNGVKSVVFIEQNQELYNSLYKNCKELGILKEVRLYKQSAENYIRRIKDLILPMKVLGIKEELDLVLMMMMVVVLMMKC